MGREVTLYCLYRDIVWHLAPLSLMLYGVKADIAAPMTFSVCRESGSTRFGSAALNNRDLPAIFKQGAGNVFLQLADTRYI